MKPTLRNRWLVIHRWLGLTAGLLFALLGLTGSLLVYDHALDEWLNPELLLSSGQGARVPVADVITAAETAYGGDALSLSRPRVAEGVWKVWFQSGSENAPTFTQVLVDPYSGEVTGQRVWGDYLMTWIYRLHFRLLAGEVGGTIVGLAGLVVLISIASGIYLWWPLWKHSWRAAIQIRKGKGNYDLHKTTGVVSGFVLVILVFTGVYMEFPDWFHATLSPISTVSKPPSELQSAGAETVAAMSADQAIATAQKYFPNAAFDHLHPPLGPEGFYEVAFRQEGEVQQSFGRTQVFLDAYSGEVLLIRSPADFTAADAFVAWQFPLHNGEAFGMFGRGIVCLTGLAPAGLYLTGMVVWWSRRRKRRRAAVGAR